MNQNDAHLPKKLRLWRAASVGCESEFLAAHRDLMRSAPKGVSPKMLEQCAADGNWRPTCIKTHMVDHALQTEGPLFAKVYLLEVDEIGGLPVPIFGRMLEASVGREPDVVRRIADRTPLDAELRFDALVNALRLRPSDSEVDDLVKNEVVDLLAGHAVHGADLTDAVVLHEISTGINFSEYIGCLDEDRQWRSTHAHRNMHAMIARRRAATVAALVREVQPSQLFSKK